MIFPFSRQIIAAVSALIIAACTASQTPPIENQFSLVDPGNYKDEQQKWLGRQQAVNDCKVKAMNASAAIEKSVAAENHGMPNQLRARDKAAEMYSASFTACMNGLGYIRN